MQQLHAFCPSLTCLRVHTSTGNGCKGGGSSRGDTCKVNRRMGPHGLCLQRLQQHFAHFGTKGPGGYVEGATAAQIRRPRIGAELEKLFAHLGIAHGSGKVEGGETNCVLRAFILDRVLADTTAQNSVQLQWPQSFQRFAQLLEFSLAGSVAKVECRSKLLYFLFV
jgi:hypothetical protein